MTAYFSLFTDSALLAMSASYPDRNVVYEGAKVSGHVGFQTKIHLFLQGGNGSIRTLASDLQGLESSSKLKFWLHPVTYMM